MKKIALCIHDLRLSNAEKIPFLIKSIMNRFNVSSLTIHLIFDKEFKSTDPIIKYLYQLIKENKIEIVFHGVTHACNNKTKKMLAWYHKYQAEFLSDSFSEKENKHRFLYFSKKGNIKIGLCPPCWIMGKKGRNFLNNLPSLYIEGLISIKNKHRRYYSPVISLGSNKKKEIFLLKGIAIAILFFSRLIKVSNIRFVLHSIDLNDNESMEFFVEKFKKLRNDGYQPVLQRELIEKI